jgi:hypothetical protein
LELVVWNRKLNGSHRASALVVEVLARSLTTWQDAVAFSIAPALLHKNRDTIR